MSGGHVGPTYLQLLGLLLDQRLGFLLSVQSLTEFFAGSLETLRWNLSTETNDNPEKAQNRNKFAFKTSMRTETESGDF